MRRNWHGLIGWDVEFPGHPDSPEDPTNPHFLPSTNGGICATM
jgi:hypothetical protein